MNEYWEVVSHWTGKVIAQCGQESDARMLCELSPKERIYRRAKFLVDQVIDVTSTTDIVVNMDGGVGGSWKEIYEQFDEAVGVKKQKQLNQSDAEVFVP